MKFKIEAKFKPAGDQPKAIRGLVKGVKNGVLNQVLLGATGTGKTFTIANVIEQTGKTTMVLSHNKTLAAQLYSELKSLFPNNRIEYFVSNFDYYRPEAYMPSSDTFIDKTSKSNWDLESMRMSSLNALLTRNDTIVVSSVAAIYGQLPPHEYKETFYQIEVGMIIERRDFFLELVKRNYSRNNIDLKSGTFRARGDVIEIAPSWTQSYYIRIDMFDNTIEQIHKVDILSGEILEKNQNITIFPANAYTTKQETVKRAILTIEVEMISRLKELNDSGRLLEAQRLEQRTKGDLESLREFGITSGIENYSRHFDGRKKDERPYTIFDYLPKNSLLIIDESHMMIPQINAMYNGDRARKNNLVEYGFRLPSALDNRPLKFAEWENAYSFQKIFVSATPSEYELNLTHGVVKTQLIRPTGLLDPQIYVVPIKGQVENMFDEIQKQKTKNERSFILTTTKRMAEELTRHFQEKNEKIAYIHSEHKAFEREEILRKLRIGIYDTIIGINLLREGIDIPEVSLVMVVDADKESFFRSTKSLIQIIGRAARNKNGRVIFYGDKITKSMKEAIDETARRRKFQKIYNLKHGIIPKTVVKPIKNPIKGQGNDGAIEEFLFGNKKDKKTKEKVINDLRNQMLTASKKMDFERAAQLRDIILELSIE